MYRRVHLDSVALLTALSLVMPAHAADSGYRLKPGDQLQIAVWREEGLDRQLAVLPDGTITFPLAGQVPVSGLTPAEVEESIAGRIGRYIPDPVVTATVIGVGGNRVYVVGKVRQPGAFVIPGPMHVMQVLSLAGGLDKFADGDSIRILRSSGEGQETIAFDYDAVLDGRKPELNILLQAGDTIVVP